MKALLALLLIGASTTTTVAVAAPHSDDWCADTVDFAMRTAQRQDEGTSKHALTTEIHSYFTVFQQQYPALDEKDMQHLVNAVYDHHLSRFKAAIGASKTCGTLPSASTSIDAPASTSTLSQ